MLALAYIRPIYDINNIGDGLSQQFAANIDDTSEQGLNSIISYDNIGTNGNEPFWTVYLLNAYQGESYRDGDGITPGDGFAPPMNEQAKVGFTLDSGLAVSLVYSEPAGPKECNSGPVKQAYACDVAAITAREVAKSLGAVEDDGGLLKLDSTILSVESLRKIRNRTRP